MSNRFAKITLLVAPFLLVAVLIAWKMVVVAHNKVEEAEMKNKMKVMRIAAAAAVARGQSEDFTLGARVVDLKSYINTKLTDSPSSPKGDQKNNLAELSTGVQLYGGVPFDVQGSIQLMGDIFKKYGKRYPEEVNDIAVHRPCNKLHFFHGTCDISDVKYGVTVAKFVLHYEDGESVEVPFAAGEQSFDFWGFPLGGHNLIPTDAVPKGWEKYAKLPAPGTQLAWVGSNPYIKQWRPMFSICLYRTTIPNPKAKPVATVDFVSMVTKAAPFLIGITVE